MDRMAGNSAVGMSAGRSRLHHKRRPGHRRNTQHSVATVEPICDMRKVVNGMVSVDQEKLNKLVQKDPIEMHYAVETEPFASGLFATVRKCRHRTTGIEYAAKYSTKLRYGQDCTTEILHEIALMSLCTTNPRIIHLIDVFDTPAHMILVMEYAPGGDLQTLMDDDMVPYERDAVKFVRQVLEGLLFLHERNLAHLDIKLQNVLLMGTFPDCDIKLCDLEISRVIVAGQEVRELLGTPDYVSPEILHYEPIGLSADIWSVGVMAYVLLTGFTPFGGDTDQETFHKICHGELDFPEELFEDISPQAEDFIRKTLNRNPSSRPTVRECLKHPWLTSWKNVASHQRETISSEGQRKSSSNSGASSFSVACPRSVSTSSFSGQSSSISQAARSLQRAMSKSREVLCERVAASNLRKSTSKSRERLCEMKFNFSRSRDHLCDLLQPSVAHSRERFQSLRNLSKSHEILSLLMEQRSPASGHQVNQHLFNHVPLTQSLECFDVVTLDPCVLEKSSSFSQQEQVGTEAIGNDPSLMSKLLNESTETLCEEKQNPSPNELSDDSTPSNSRPATPIRGQVGQTVVDLVKDSISLDEKNRTLNAGLPPEEKPVEVISSEHFPQPYQNESAEQAATLLENVESPCVQEVTIGSEVRRSSLTDGTFKAEHRNSTLTSPSVDDVVLLTAPAIAKSLTGMNSSSGSAIDQDSSAVGQKKAGIALGAEPVSPLSDASPLTETQRQLLNVCLNRRRASWACDRQEVANKMHLKLPDSSGMKKHDSKLSVSELISSFNRGESDNSAALKSNKSLTKQSQSKQSIPEKGDCLQVAPTSEPASLIGQKLNGKAQSGNSRFDKSSSQTSVTGIGSLPKAEGSTRLRLYHPAWELRSLPGLPEVGAVEDSDSSSVRPSDCTLLPPSSHTVSRETQAIDSEVKIVPKAGAFEMRSGSVSSDTGCSSSSDISDRSSDDNPDPGPLCKGGGKNDLGPAEKSNVTPKDDSVRMGRPRSLSVQSDTSLLAQPWNRVCVGSVARAFEKFGTKVECEWSPGRSDQQPPHPSSLRSRRQSTPGPLK